jgi:DNA-binding CsgD family transcriptional regulator
MSSSASNPWPRKALRVAIVATDPVHREELASIVLAAGHEVVIATNEAEAVLSVDEGFRARERSVKALLTPREFEMLTAISAGLGNKAIARRFDISLHTVKFHIESLFRKLGVRTRAEAVAKGLERRRTETVEL